MILVVGAGFSGATIANLLAEKSDEQVLVVDKKDHIGGNCYDYRDKNGIMIHAYGSHIFHTNSEKVWNYLKQFTDFNTYMHKVIGILDGIETHIPFNFNTLYDVFPKSYAELLEHKLLDNFNINTKVPILEFQKQDDDDLKYLANDKNIKINFCTKINKPYIEIDILEIKRVINNLLSNAIEYSYNNNCIDINLESKNNSFIFEIKDYGIGINTENLNNIFEEYMTLAKQYKKTGFGLGLNICKKIIEQHNGEISINSKYGSGTSIKFQLPA